MKPILVTGGAGFIGSNFIHYYLRQQPGANIINLDSLTYAGDLANLEGLQDEKRYTFVKGDICDEALVASLFEEFDIGGVIHFAAESHVDNSISGPGVFIRTNINGTFTLLDTARNHWMTSPFTAKAGYEDCRFLHISTDEVYGSLGPEGYFTEQTPYAPNSPYSASKASSDMLVRSYNKTYGLNTVITNCSNNYGPRQNEEKLIPVVIKSALEGRDIPIYGDGGNIRDWLFVDDHCSGIARAYASAKSGSTFNIGTNCELSNIQLAQAICDRLDKINPRPDGESYSNQIRFVADRPGHDRRYAIDASRIRNELGWQPDYQLEQGLDITIQWYVQQFLDA